jgi:ComF family protein
MGAERLSQRGYNQAALLAFPLALSLGVPYRPHAIRKIRETPSQVGLTAIQRRANVIGVFRAEKEEVLGRHVLLVDDVTTSGSTLNECAATMLEAGASQVYGLTLARTVFRDPEEPIDV